MGKILTPLISTDNSSPIYQESIYDNPCSDSRNERQAFCQTILGLDHKAGNKG